MPHLHVLLLQAIREWFSHPHTETVYQLQLWFQVVPLPTYGVGRVYLI
jgi:hypothetical protein